MRDLIHVIRGAAWALAGAVIVGGSTPAAGQQDLPASTPSGPTLGGRADDHALAPVVHAVRRTSRIALDGRLDDEVWNNAVVATGFIQTEPDEGQPSTERTEVYVVYDDDALYIGARLWDSSGDVRQRLGRRDSYLMDSDWFHVMIDSHHDHLTAYQFSVNPAGVKRDEVHNGGSRADASWDAVWDAATSVDAEGWTVELRIPFSQLRFAQRDEHVWGIQMSRRVNRLQEVSVLSFTPRRDRGGVARYGHLHGLQGIGPGRRWEIMPYSLGRAEYTPVTEGNPFRDGSDYFRGAGIDAKYRLTSALTIDATINPDFGQVEVDPATVNLSAFEQSLQEKRPFFVEGADIFRFGDTRLFYSRRIGRAPQGSLPSGTAFSDRPDAASILGAAKITGRTSGGWSLGFLEAVTGQTSATWQNRDGDLGETIVEPATNYAIGRALRDLRGGQTQLGAIASAVNRRLDGTGLDRQLRSAAYAGGLDISHEFLNRTWSAEGVFAYSWVTGSPEAMLRTQLQSSRYYQRPDADHLTLDPELTSMNGFAAKFDVGRRAGLHWRGDANFTYVSPGLEINDMGFLTGVDRMNAGGSLVYVQNTPTSRFRSYRISTGPQLNWNTGGDFLGGRVNLNTNWQFLNFWGANVNITKRVVGFDDRLTRGGPLARARGGQSIGGMINSDSRRTVSGRINMNYSWGEGDDGGSRISANLSMRPAEYWSMSIGPSLNRNFTSTQYVTAVTDSLKTSTFGRRYIFTELRQTTVSMDTRVNVNFTPTLSFEMFAQPFISTADYGALRELEAARTSSYLEYGRDIGTVTYDADTRTFHIDPDEGGPASKFTVANRDFNTLSLRGNAVLRWEYRPGSTLYLVAQQRRSDNGHDPQLDLWRDARGMLRSPASTMFVAKVNYWLNL
ncbi:MAG TPA: DUF5916 domain-containing protein [Longimicrobiales bacterium]|nr:DUF5916 domain-containing protein [Longimicrobiales bacterium]